MIGPNCDTPISGLKIPDFGRAVKHIKMHGIDSLPLKQQLVFGELFNVRNKVRAWDKSVAEGAESLSAAEKELIADLDPVKVDEIRLDDQTLEELNKIDPDRQGQIDSDLLNEELVRASSLLRQTREGISEIVGDQQIVTTLRNNSESPLWDELSATDQDNLRDLFEVEQSLDAAIGKTEASAGMVVEESGLSGRAQAPDPETVAMSRAFVSQVGELPGTGADRIAAHKTKLAQQLSDVRSQIRLKEIGTEPLIAQKARLQGRVEEVRVALENDPNTLPEGAMELDRALTALDNEIAYVDSLPSRQALLSQEDALVRQEYLLKSTEDGFNPRLKIAGIEVPNMYRLLSWLDEMGEGFPEAKALTEDEAESRERIWQSLPKPFRSAINRALTMVKDVGHRVTRAGQGDVLREATQQQQNRQTATAADVEVKSGFSSEDLENEIRDKMPTISTNLRGQYAELAGDDFVRAYDAWSKVFTDKIDPVMHDDELRSLARDFLMRDGVSDESVAEALDPMLASLDRQGTAEFLAARTQLAYSIQRSGRIADQFLNLGADATDEVRAETSKLLIRQLAQTLGLQRAYRQTVRGIGRTLRAAGLPLDAEAVASETRGKIAAAWVDTVKHEANNRPVKMLGHAISTGMDDAISRLESNMPVNWKDQALQEELSVLAVLAKDMEAEPVTGILADQLEKAAKIGVNGLLTARTANILSAWPTFWMNTVNGIFRVAALPIYPVFGAAVTPQELPKALKRAALTYVQIGKQFSGAMRLGAISFREGVGLWDPIGTRIEGQASSGIVDDVVEVRPEQGWDLNRVTDSGFKEKFPHWKTGMNLLWKVQTAPLRFLSSSDTMLKSLAGNAEEWVRLYEQNYDILARSGDTEDIGRKASLRADKALKAKLMDVIINPDDPTRRTVIPEAAMRDEHALNTGRQVTFTDDFLIEPEGRSLKRGEELADRRGVDEAERPYQVSDYMRQQGGKRISKAVTNATYALWIWPKVLADMKRTPGIGPVVAIVSPFIKTPTNIIKSAMRHGPTAPLVDSWWRDVTSEDIVTRQRARGEVVLGSIAIGATIYALNHNNNIEITGAGPFQYDTRKMWREAEGKVPYSFRTRKDENSEWSEWISYRSFEPLASLVGMLADYRMMNAMITEEERERAASLMVLKLVGMGANSMMGKTWFTGIQELTEMIQRTQRQDTNIPGRKHPFFRWIERNAATFAPYSSFVRQAKRNADPTVRTVPAGNFGTELIGELGKVVSVPGWDPQLPPVLDPLTGDPIVLQGINGGEWQENLFLQGLTNASPHVAFQTPAYPSDPVKRAIADAGIGVGPYSGSPVKRRFTHQGRIKDNHMTHEEYSAWLTYRTKGLVEIDGRAWTLYDRLNAVINSDLYQSLPDYDGRNREIQRNYRAEMLQKEIARFDEMADRYFLASPAADRINDNLARFKPLDNIDDYTKKFGHPPDARIVEQATDEAYARITGN